MAGPVEIRGHAFLGATSRRVDAAIEIAGDTARLVGSDGRALLDMPAARLRFEPPLGRAARRASLPDGTLFETDDHRGVEAFEGATAGGALSRAERFGPRLALVAALAALGVFAIWKYALSALVWLAVLLTPEPLRDAMDAGIMQALDVTLAEPSELAARRREEVDAVFADLASFLPGDPPRGFRLEFRAIAGIGPNALAMPGGTVVVTDALVREYPGEDVIAGVLAHELGHVVEDHGLAGLYRSLGIFVLVALIAGDTGPLIEDALLEGGVLLSLSHSRGQEARADAFAVELARRAGYDPEGLAGFFESLPDGERTGTGWWATHPASGARAEAIRDMIEGR